MITERLQLTRNMQEFTECAERLGNSKRGSRPSGLWWVLELELASWYTIVLISKDSQFGLLEETWNTSYEDVDELCG